MKIVLSRKGFDSASGGVASVILPDGRLQTIPIAEETRFASHRQTIQNLFRGYKN